MKEEVYVGWSIQAKAIKSSATCSVRAKFLAGRVSEYLTVNSRGERCARSLLRRREKPEQMPRSRNARNSFRRLSSLEQSLTRLLTCENVFLEGGACQF